MEKENQHGETPDSRPGFLTAADTQRLTDAIAEGIKIANEKPDSPKLWWLWPILLLLVPAGFGIWGFNVRPAQDVTFSGAFDPGSELTVQAAPELRQLVSGKVTGVGFGGHDGPITVTLTLSPDQAEALAAALGQVHQPGVPILVDGPLLTFAFSQPTEVIITAQNTVETVIGRRSDNNGATSIYLAFKAAATGTDNDGSPLVSATIVQPQKETYSFSINVSGTNKGEFTLQPIRIDEESIVTVLVNTNPHRRSIGNTIDLVFPTDTPDFQAAFSQSPFGATDTARGFENQTIQIQETPGGLLALGPVTETMTTGQRVSLYLARPKEVDISGKKITVDAQNDRCVINAVSNGRTKLLPPWFDLWPDWVQELWRWGAVTLTTTIFLALARKQRWIPS